MKSITINGGRPLEGKITASGSKNAALPILFATLVAKGVSEIENLPDIGDVRVAIEILRDMGVSVERVGGLTVIDSTNARYSPPDPFLIGKIRASTYLIGACLGRFGVCSVGEYGGCSFSDRPIDLHIDAMRSLGAYGDAESMLLPLPRAGEIALRLPSVGATVNALILASSIKGESRIKGAAREPHVSALIDFLVSAGAEIRAEGDVLTVKGGGLHGGKTRIIGDMIEGFSYLVCGLATHGEVKVDGVDWDTLLSPLSALTKLGYKVDVENGVASVTEGAVQRALAVTAEPYPGFPTDLQPIISPLLALNAGGVIIDKVFSERFGYLEVLKAFGVRSRRIISGAIIERAGLFSAEAVAPDLRGGMAAIITALAAPGKSVIHSADIVLRGYERLEEKLTSIGAQIRTN